MKTKEPTSYVWNNVVEKFNEWQNDLGFEHVIDHSSIASEMKKEQLETCRDMVVHLR